LVLAQPGYGFTVYDPIGFAGKGNLSYFQAFKLQSQLAGMSVIYLTYANKEDKPLHHLKAEAEAINKLLAGRKLQNHFLLEIDPYTSLKNIAFYINKYRDRLLFFGFSGHAGRDVLFTEEETAHAPGIAALLGQCPNLKVVFLNGCSTVGQVQGLLEAGVKAVIAAHAPIGDELARDFADNLFQALNEQRTLEEAYKHAKACIQAKDTTIVFAETRGFGRQAKDSDWGLFCLEGEEEVLGWKLPTEATEYALNLPLKKHADAEVLKVLFIADKASKENFYSKIRNSFREELKEGQIYFNDLLSISSEVHREGTFDEVEAADAIVFLVNGLDFFNLWEKIPWLKGAIQQFEKTCVFIKLAGGDEPLEGLVKELEQPSNILPEYRDMFQNLPSFAIDDYIFNSFKRELIKKIRAAISQKGVAPEKLKEELLDFDLGPQSREFDDFLDKGWRYNLVLIQGTDRCGQGLLLNRLTGDLPGKNRPFDIDFKASEAPVKEEAQLWRKLSEYLIQTP